MNYEKPLKTKFSELLDTPVLRNIICIQKGLENLIPINFVTDSLVRDNTRKILLPHSEEPTKENLWVWCGRYRSDRSMGARRTPEVGHGKERRNVTGLMYNLFVDNTLPSKIGSFLKPLDALTPNWDVNPFHWERSLYGKYNRLSKTAADIYTDLNNNTIDPKSRARIELQLNRVKALVVESNLGFLVTDRRLYDILVSRYKINSKIVDVYFLQTGREIPLYG